MTQGNNPSRPGPVHDRAMHYIIENDLDAVCDWLDIKTTVPIDLLSPEFTAESSRADLLVRVGPKRLLHAEYIRTPRADVYVRMIGYRAQIMRRYPNMTLTQYAIVLGTGRLRSGDDPENGFFLGLRTIYLSRTDPSEFLSRPGLAALSLLAKGDQQTRTQSAMTALQQIHTLPESAGRA
jgi:hypothetical protein